MDYNANIFSQIFRKFGYDILLNKKRFLSIFTDYAPQQELVKHLLEYIYDSNVMDYIYSSITDSNNPFSLIRQAFTKMVQTGYSKDLCWKILSDIFNAVDLKIIKPESVQDAENIVEMSNDNILRELAIDYLWYYSMSGDGYAMYVLGTCYRCANGVEKDDELAYEWYKKSSDCGYPDGISELGQCYEIGLFVDINIDKAIEYYEKAFNAGSIKACGYLGAILSDVDKEKSEKYTKLALEKDDLLTWHRTLMLKFALNQLTKNDIDMVVSIKDRLNKRSMRALKDGIIMSLGMIYSYGIVTEKNNELAIRYFDEIISSSDNNSMICLACSYEGAIYYNKGDACCIDLLKKASQGNIGMAEYYLFNAFDQGKFVEKNVDESVDWLKKAAIHGDSKAQFILGCILLSEDEERQGYELKAKFNQDVEKGLALLEMSAKNNCKEAAEVLVNKYTELSKTSEEILYWVRIGAKLGSLSCMMKLGIIEKENGNYSEAEKWLSTCLTEDNIEVKHNLAMCIMGDIKRYSPDRLDYSIELLTDAAGTGHLESMLVLSAYYEQINNYKQADKWYEKMEQLVKIEIKNSTTRDDKKELKEGLDNLKKNIKIAKKARKGK